MLHTIGLGILLIIICGALGNLEDLLKQAAANNNPKPGYQPYPYSTDPENYPQMTTGQQEPPHQAMYAER